jgi:hypothetical protein
MQDGVDWQMCADRDIARCCRVRNQSLATDPSFTQFANGGMARDPPMLGRDMILRNQSSMHKSDPDIPVGWGV